MREFNAIAVGTISIVVLVALIGAALNYSHLPFINRTVTYRADFANSGGLLTNDVVTVAGVRVGDISGVALHGDRVRVTMKLRPGLDLGSQTTASAKILSTIGTEYLELNPSGPGRLDGLIPLAHTSVPFTIVDSLSQLATNTASYNIHQMVHALQAVSSDLAGTPASVTTAALDGLARFSAVLSSRRSELATIITQGSGLAGVLSQHSTQLFDVLGQANLVLGVLQQRRAAIQQLLAGTAALSQQITAVLTTEHAPLSSMLVSLQTVTGLLAKDSTSIGNALPLLAAFSRYAANATGSGRFVDAVVPTLLIPDNLATACANPANYPSTNPLVGCRP